MNEYMEYIQKQIDKYGQDKLIEAGIVLLENEREIKTLGDLTGQICCLTECKNWPVVIHEYERRTPEEKELHHDPCCSNLYKWIIEEAKKIEDDNESNWIY